jgi:hypothetical protein
MVVEAHDGRIWPEGFEGREATFFRQRVAVVRQDLKAKRPHSAAVVAVSDRHDAMFFLGSRFFFSAENF